MTTPKIASRAIWLITIALLSLVSAVAYAAGKQDGYALIPNTAAPTPQMVDVNTPPPVPPQIAGRQSQQVQPSAVSSMLSYYFISGNTFTPDLGSSPYVRQVTGCVNQMPLSWPFSAPVHLPQGSVVVSLTLFTYDSAITTTVSTAYFLLNDGKGLGGYTVSAGSLPNINTYQQITSTQNNPTTIDNGRYNYYVQWRTSGSAGSPYLSLCGVRVAYYAPLGATYLPIILK